MSDIPETLDGRCATCQNWDGNKDSAALNFEENPVSMSPTQGWPGEGDCNTRHLWLNIAVHGDALVSLTVDANFGCVYYEADENE